MSWVRQISVRDEDQPVWDAAERLAKEREQPLSRLVSRALRLYIEAEDEQRARSEAARLAP